MESEKVKEIKVKEALETLCYKYKDVEGWEMSRRQLIDILNLINELESENERLSKSFENAINEIDKLKECYKVRAYDKLRAENKKLKDRIAELEKGNEALSFAVKQGFNDCQAKTLEQFAERLKEKFDEQKQFYETASISLRDISLTSINMAYRCLDETLKEFINGKV